MGSSENTGELCSHIEHTSGNMSVLFSFVEPVL